MRQEHSGDKVPESCKEKDLETCQSPSIKKVHDKDEGKESKDNLRKGIFQSNTYFGNDIALND